MCKFKLRSIYMKIANYKRFVFSMMIGFGQIEMSMFFLMNRSLDSRSKGLEVRFPQQVAYKSVVKLLILCCLCPLSSNAQFTELTGISNIYFSLHFHSLGGIPCSKWSKECNPIHPGLDSQYKLVFVLFMIGCLDVSDTQWLRSLVKGVHGSHPFLLSKRGFSQFLLQRGHTLL